MVQKWSKGCSWRETKGRKFPRWLLLSWNPMQFFQLLLSKVWNVPILPRQWAGFHVTFFPGSMGHTWGSLVVSNWRQSLFHLWFCPEQASFTQQIQTAALRYYRHGGVFPHGACVLVLPSQIAHMKTGGTLMSNKAKMQSWCEITQISKLTSLSNWTKANVYRIRRN